MKTKQYFVYLGRRMWLNGGLAVYLNSCFALKGLFVHPSLSAKRRAIFFLLPLYLSLLLLFFGLSLLYYRVLFLLLLLFSFFSSISFSRLIFFSFTSSSFVSLHSLNHPIPLLLRRKPSQPHSVNCLGAQDAMHKIRGYI